MFDLSIVIPSFNSAPWLPSTLQSLNNALSRTDLQTEVVLVDDGSTDDTLDVVTGLQATFSIPLNLVSQENSGVFAARLRGAREAQSERLLFLDSRVLVAPDAFAHLEKLLETDPMAGATRVGHVATDEQTPLVGRFWEVPTHVFWGRYLKAPKLTVLTPENFDSVPKGTGFLLSEKQLFLAACEHVGAVGDRFVSDDTKLLRFMVQQREMVLDPGFRATYRPRASISKFLGHGFLRGTLFVDSYYGTGLARNAVLWVLSLSLPVTLIALVLALAGVATWPFSILIMALVLLMLGLIVVAAVNRAPGRSLAGFIIYMLPFTAVFWAGIVRGLWLRFWVRPR